MDVAAQAALLIQGSTCIYSKKVEHLYVLVYQCLNQVIEQKRTANQASAIGVDGADADVAEMTADEDAWLTLVNLAPSFVSEHYFALSA